jgi:hypothetical protein
MNYLYKNRDNSRKLPFDVMNIIYDYADYFRLVKQQIVNKDYNLDEIKYKRMIREIEKYFINSYNGWYEYNLTNKYNRSIFVTPHNIHTIKKKYMLSHYDWLFNINKQKRYKICGLDKDYLYSYRNSMISSLEANGDKVNRRYSTKQLYKKWLKL